MQVERQVCDSLLTQTEERQTGQQYVGTYPRDGNSGWKRPVMPDSPEMVKVRVRLRSGRRGTRQLVGQRPTKPSMPRGCESMAPTTGTETLPRHLRVAAVENLPQWTQVRWSDATCGKKAFGLQTAVGGDEDLWGTLHRFDKASEEARAKYVPAAAVIRTARALFGITGCKGCVGGSISQV
eukprot:TRINITY_DN2199_c0_g1_i2.p1 TRINITY_DN2199_c0_g1~~TRINITY_DN2199_c0_g1_i2.p1  ORF type:complete len:181 (-),score=16.81 TRINITY_DN2199_c0_g1_i2:541-1083(-)